MNRDPDERYRRKLPFRGRGLDDLALRTGGVVADIDERLSRRDHVRVLELGCGYGTALLQLRRRYGRRVELHGINRERGDGDADEIARHGRRQGLIEADADAPLPTIAFGDVATGLPYPADHFDVVFSQVAWLYFGNKIGVLREVSRVLATDGIARIDADELCPKLPPEYQRLVEIWRDGRIVPFADYLGTRGLALVAAGEGHFLRVTKVTGLGDDLVPVCEIDTALLDPHWDGVKCVYRQVVH